MLQVPAESVPKQSQTQAVARKQQQEAASDSAAKQGGDSKPSGLLVSGPKPARVVAKTRRAGRSVATRG